MLNKEIDINELYLIGNHLQWNSIYNEPKQEIQYHNKEISPNIIDILYKAIQNIIESISEDMKRD